MSPTITLILYCLLILAASLAGGWIPLVLRLTHRRMELAVSFVAGVMLGVGLLHMLPHALMAVAEGAESAANPAAGAASGLMLNHSTVHSIMDPLVLWLLAGFLTMFFIERFFCFHHHDVPPQAGVSSSDHDHNGEQGAHHSHGPGCSHNHSDAAQAPASHKHTLTWTGAAIGLSLHSLIEGIALAASIAAGAVTDGHGHDAAEGHTDAFALAGLGTFFVIFLHKPFDSLTLGALMSFGGRSRALRHIVNAAFALLVPVGVALFYLGIQNYPDRHVVIAAALAFSAGTFLCIAMSDLLPELQFHSHDRIKLTLTMLAGLAIAWLIGMMEAATHSHADHTHDGLNSAVQDHEHGESHDHDHDGDDVPHR